MHLRGSVVWISVQQFRKFVVRSNPGIISPMYMYMPIIIHRAPAIISRASGWLNNHLNIRKSEGHAALMPNEGPLYTRAPNKQLISNSSVIPDPFPTSGSHIPYLCKQGRNSCIVAIFSVARNNYYAMRSLFSCSGAFFRQYRLGLEVEDEGRRQERTPRI